jgi:hypothetical protein
VSAVGGRHTLHAYYTANPEHPDGSAVLLYSSRTAEAHEGEILVLQRETGEERVLARGVSTEDSHRAACQQWVCGGRTVVYHDVRQVGGREEWVVAGVDAAGGEARLLARGRQLGWGQPHAGLVPLYGPHWDPGAHRDLDLLDVQSGECRTVLSAEAVRDAYPELIREEFGALAERPGHPLSIFFPTLSPDLSRVFFKLAAPLGGHYRSAGASKRAMLVCYDLTAGRLLFADRKWGHPAWHPDSQTILDVPHVLIDAASGHRRTLPGLPRLPGSHPSWSPDGRLYVSDVLLARSGGAPGEWGIALVEPVGESDDSDKGSDGASQALALLHRFDHSRGATSWRPCHPHPVFSADGERIYFCASSTRWSTLYVAERSKAR